MVGRRRRDHTRHYQPHFVHQPHPTPFGSETERTKLRPAKSYNLKPHPDLRVRPLRLGQRRASPEHDPLAQAKRVLSQPKFDIRKLHNDGDPEGRNLI